MNPNETTSNLFTSGPSLQEVPKGDAAREAVASLRGYAYQIAASALAWLDLKADQQLYLEVAEDYAVAANTALKAVQVKDTIGSGSVTLNTKSVSEAIASYVDLVARNPSRSVRLHFLTTSPIGKEKKLLDRPGGMAGLDYWRKAAADLDVGPLRAILEDEGMPENVRLFVSSRDDDTLRRELLRNVHWECGQPSLSPILLELGERLIVLGRDRYHVPSAEARRLVDLVIHHVLKKSVLNEPCERMLTRAELDEVIDSLTRVSVPRAQLEDLLLAISGGVNGGAPTSAVLAVAKHASWLVFAADLPSPHRVIPRPALETHIRSALAKYGVVNLAGGTGVGKSLISHTVACGYADNFAIVYLRDANAEEVRRRLDTFLGHVGDLEAPVVVLEDLNYIDDPGVLLAFERVVAALRRRDCFALITSYRPPSTRTLAALGLDAGACIEVPYFTEQEAGEVVQDAGGDPAIWGRIAYIAGGAGHPQLVHAFAAGLAVRKWPKEEIRDVVGRGISSEGIDDARDAARRSLMGALPDGAKTLLYRTSLIIGRFDRALALEIGALAPAVRRAGEYFDQLVGPWIEAVGSGSYRVSPLASNAGNEMLLQKTQGSIHNLIATQLISRKTIETTDADVVFAHALLMRWTAPAAGIAMCQIAVVFINRQRGAVL